MVCKKNETLIKGMIKSCPSGMWHNHKSIKVRPLLEKPDKGKTQKLTCSKHVLQFSVA